MVRTKSLCVDEWERPSRRRDRFERWRRDMALKEYAHFVDRQLPGSADAHKEATTEYGAWGRSGVVATGNPLKWAENEARKAPQWADVISQKKAHLSKKWALPRHGDIHPIRKWTASVQPPPYRSVFR